MIQSFIKVEDDVVTLNGLIIGQIVVNTASEGTEFETKHAAFLPRSGAIALPSPVLADIIALVDAAQIRANSE